ncbi:MAG: sulfatase [Candidatus Aminicenantes bacterium]|nr:sulfatase [Candidatus Aminicenantes bacterium]
MRGFEVMFTRRLKQARIFYPLVVISVLIFHPCCSRKISQDNFILITLDTQREDHISAYNPGRASTPNIDGLAEQGILFDNCYSLIPITLPSHASIFYSQPPHMIKNYNNGQPVHPKRKRPSFINAFKKNGFITAAFVSLGVLKSNFNLNEGFDTYVDSFPSQRWYLTAEEVNEKAIPWLESNQNNKFFLWLHYSDPHDPYSPPDHLPDCTLYLNEEVIGKFNLGQYEKHEITFDLKEGHNEFTFHVENSFDPGPFKARLDILDFNLTPEMNKVLNINLFWGWFIRQDPRVYFMKEHGIIHIDNSGEPCSMTLTFRGKLNLPLEGVQSLYRQEVEYMDKELGRLFQKLKELGLMEKTHILLVGDHGEGLGEYINPLGDPHIGHIHYLENIYMKVPLIIYNPHKKKAERFSQSVTLIDLAPTIFQIMGLKKFSHFKGRDIFSRKKKSRDIFQETYAPEAIRDRFALLRYPHHLIFCPAENQYTLYHLENDPYEKQNIFSTESLSPEIAKLKNDLDDFARNVIKSKEEIKIDKETEDMLRSLGYIK